ncbi:hypothetical protein BH10PLA2_BH10PLA2_05880 [soil metagenome]
MAKSESLEDAVLIALRKAMVKLPESLPPTGKEGLFPGGAKGKSLMELAVAEGYIRIDSEKVKVGKSTKTFQKTILLDKGLQKVLETDSPKAALEALVPAVQALNKQSSAPDINAFRHELERATKSCMDALNVAFANLQADVLKTIQPTSPTLGISPDVVLSAVQQAIEKIKPAPQLAVATTAPGVSSSAKLEEEIGGFVDAWVKEKGVGCSFDELWNHLKGRQANLTIGEFQDALRNLHDAHRIRLGGWPKMLDDLPQPQLALFISSKVMYYAQPASGNV